MELEEDVLFTLEVVVEGGLRHVEAISYLA
jgi:hypothetical protein